MEYKKNLPLLSVPLMGYTISGLLLVSSDFQILVHVPLNSIWRTKFPRNPSIDLRANIPFLCISILAIISKEFEYKALYLCFILLKACFAAATSALNHNIMLEERFIICYNSISGIHLIKKASILNKPGSKKYKHFSCEADCICISAALKHFIFFRIWGCLMEAWKFYHLGFRPFICDKDFTNHLVIE